MIDVKRENIFEFVNASRQEINAFDKEFAKKLLIHRKAGEIVFIYAYIAGHGCADGRQYFLLNCFNAKQAMYNIEEKLRQKSAMGAGKNFVTAVYDICRLQGDAEKMKSL